jgi:hypothetical protein
MIITIFLKPSNKKYLQKKFLFNDVLKVSDANPIGWMLKEILKPKPRKFEYISFENMVQCDFELLDDKFFSHLVHIDRHSTYTLNEFVDEMMRIEFLSHMYALTEYASVDINEAVYHFIDKYDFQDSEITFDALRRYYTRNVKFRDSKLLSA